MAKFQLKEKVHTLRRSGKSLRDICSIMNLSKSTVALWCREVELTDEQKQTLHDRIKTGGFLGRQKGADVNKQKKLRAKEEAAQWARKSVAKLSARDKFIAGIALYWAEGSKAESSTGFVLVNSDPVMIKFMYDWLIECMDVSPADIFAQISINEIHRYRIDEVLNFWSRLLDLPAGNFSKTFFAKAVQKKVYANHSVHYGVLRLGVRRSSYLKYKVLEMIRMLKDMPA